MNNRKCIATNKTFSREQLIRIVKTKNDIFKVNSESQGRGAYIYRDNEAIKKVIKLKILHKTFRTNVPKEAYIELEKLIK